MSKIAIQQREIRMGAYFYNGAFRPFQGYPINVLGWNVNAFAEKDFGKRSVTDQAYNGFERNNTQGFRLNADVSVDNIDTTEADKYRALINFDANNSGRMVFNDGLVTAAGDASTTIVFTNTIQTDGYYTGLLVFGTSSMSAPVLITNYVGATRTATIAAARTWAFDDNFEFTAPRAIKTYFGMALDTSDGNIKYFNMPSMRFGIEKSLTLGEQRLSFSLRGAERETALPDGYQLV